MVDIGGFDNIVWRPNGKTLKLLIGYLQKSLQSFQTFILGQKNIAPKLYEKFGINLVFYGENEAEYGNPIADNSKSIRDKSFYTTNKNSEMCLVGIKIKDLIKDYNISYKDLLTYLPINEKELLKKILKFIISGII